jgi:tetratricopeptide (TPR) repeat protein
MRSFFHVLIALALVGFVAGGRCLAEPPAASPSANASAFDAMAKDIATSVLSLGYPQQTADDLVQLVRDWKCEQWRQKLSQARADTAADKTARVARAEEEVTNGLYQTIGREFSSDRKKETRTFYLSELVKQKKTQCVGYTQLLYILGGAVGLTVRPMEVRQPCVGDLPLGYSHVACLVDRSDGKAMMVDLSYRFVSRPFSLQDEFTDAGTYLQLKREDNPLKLHKRIRILDESGLKGQVFGCLGNAYFRAGDKEQALSCFNKSVEFDPADCSAYYNRGCLYLKQNQSEEAVSDCTKAIELDPTYTRAYSVRGVAQDSLGRHEQAFADFAKAIELNPKDADAYRGRAIVNALLGKTNDAKKDLRKALELNPASKEEIRKISDTFKLGLE